MKYVSVDIETTGLDEKENQIIEFAAIIEDSNNPLSYEDSPKYHRIVLSSNGYYNFSAFASQLNSGIMKIISNIEQGINVDFILEGNGSAGFLFDVELLGDFYLWLYANGIYKHPVTGVIEIVAAGKNFAGFDKRFIEANSEFETTGLRFNHRSLDPTLGFIDWENDLTPPGTNECLKRAKIEKIVTHRALDDAWDVIQLLRTTY